MDISKILDVSSSGMRAQGERMRVIAENMANANSTAKEPGGEPYRRKIVTFRSVLDREAGIERVEVDRVQGDQRPFGRRFDPGHPAADASGYVLTPNVNSLIEMVDMREAQRSYEANLSMVAVAKDMLRRTIELLN
ncbi:MAG: flagellar basal body rod protein FlgC [Alphaproteobacteria bacterium]